jgi:hypothetical protein
MMKGNISACENIFELWYSIFDRCVGSVKCIVGLDLGAVGVASSSLIP